MEFFLRKSPPPTSRSLILIYTKWKFVDKRPRWINYRAEFLNIVKLSFFRKVTPTGAMLLLQPDRQPNDPRASPGTDRGRREDHEVVEKLSLQLQVPVGVHRSEVGLPPEAG